MTRDEYADRLAEVAAELATRVRDDNPDANLRWLLSELPSEQARLDLLFVLAAAVPDDQPWSALTAWASAGTAGLKPHGTQAAAQRHRYRKEPLCGPCREAERARDRNRKKTAYWAAKARTAPTSEETRSDVAA